MVYNKSKLISGRIAIVAATDIRKFSTRDPAHRRFQCMPDMQQRRGTDGMDEPESEAI
ncbi:hypothetical protein [Paenibacillus thiaminolyticus]|uniref:hypothetical protein n=1 Tax=Paenibacillus thiaminolyticus TaxID=49283 RepID=UPI00160144CB|nr:hypothetical protein [Paenibacillus thiaminolyticus]